MTDKNGVRVNKYLAESGICSRRSADLLVAEGKVTINGQLAKAGDRISSQDQVIYNGEQISLISQKRYFALNKPKGYVCSTKDENGRPSCLDLIKSSERLFTVGRLDIFSEGLIIITNDGQFAQSIIHPKNKITKTYELLVAGDSQVIKDLSNIFLRGVSIDGALMQVDKVVKIGQSNNQTNFRIQIHQGFNRQLRKMVASLGLRVESLKRISIGELTLGSLESGKFREIKIKDVV